MPPADRLVQVDQGDVEIGFALGTLRDARSVDDFSISRFPVTVGEFQECVDAGVCEHVSTPHCIDGQKHKRGERTTVTKADSGKPATCVGVDQAQKYCSWSDGKLPTLEQWMLAARGPQVQRFSWGSQTPTCEQHPAGLKTIIGDVQPNGELTPSSLASLRVEPCKGEGIFNVGKHQAGASPLGLEDVLLTQAELLRASKRNFFAACRLPAKEEAGSSATCLVYGQEPGAIDSVEGLSAPAEHADKDDIAALPYGFRCAWSQEDAQ